MKKFIIKTERGTHTHEALSSIDAAMWAIEQGYTYIFVTAL